MDRDRDPQLKVSKKLNSINMINVSVNSLMLSGALRNEMNINGLQTGEYIAVVVQNYE